MTEHHQSERNLQQFISENATWLGEMKREKASQFIASLNEVEFAHFLFSMNEHFPIFLNANFKNWSNSHHKVMHKLLYALATAKVRWTSELALWATGSMATNGGDIIEDVKLFRAISKANVIIERSLEADQVFEICMDRVLDSGQGIEIRKTLCRIFGRIYIPTLLTAVQPYANISFLRFLASLVAALEQVVRERGNQAGAVPDVLYRELAFPLDRQRILEFEQAYRTWENAFGEYRWIEVLPPQWRGDRFPELLTVLSVAKGSSPSSKWLEQFDKLVDRLGSEAVRNCLLQQAADFGGGRIVAESEELWIGKARVYAKLYELYSQVPESVDPVRAQLGRTAIHCLPWVGTDNKIREYCPPLNPIAVSASNTSMMKGVAWALSRFPHEEATMALRELVTGGTAQIDTIHGPRTRALAVANAAVIGLSLQNNKFSINALIALQSEVEEPRVRKLIEEKLKLGR